jgi:RimJ/RimL family protein N-acetyltransferase
MYNRAMNSNPAYFLTSKRLGFRIWTEDDSELASLLWGDAIVIQFIDSRDKLTPEEIQQRLEIEISHEKRFHLQYWPIFLLETDTFVGCCGLRPYDTEKGIMEIGVHICSEHWRKGYAVEAVKAVIKYAFENKSASGLFAGHNPKNEISKILLNKLGFQFTHDEFYEPTGLMHPSYMLTKEQFLKLYHDI